MKQLIEQRVTLQTAENIAYVTLNRADKRNALDMAMFKAIDRISRQLRRDRSIRAVIVQGDGVDFCSGLDVHSVMSRKSAVISLLGKWLPGRANLAQRVSCNWRRIPVPVIMVLQGRCWGGGLQIALGGDFRIAAVDASFSIMEGKWGLIPDMGGNLALRELVSKDTGLKLAMTAEVLSAQQALDYGLVSQLSAEPLEVARQLAKQISDRSPDAVAAVKKLYHRNWYQPAWRMLASESYYQVRILLGKNQSRAVKRQMDPENKLNYFDRNRW